MDVSDFSMQVLYAWSYINVYTPQNVSDVVDQILWQKSFILRQKQLWLNMPAMNAGMRTIRDIYKIQDSRFLHYDELVAKYEPVMNFVAYCGLIVSIPRSWKVILKDRIMEEKTVTGLEAK